MDKWASKRARLLFTTTCLHVPVDFLVQALDFMDQTDHLIVTAENFG